MCVHAGTDNCMCVVYLSRGTMMKVHVYVGYIRLYLTITLECVLYIVA